MSTKKKVKKKKKVYHDDHTHENTLGAEDIHSDYLRGQQQAIDALPVGDPDSEHFDESKYDKTEYHQQTLDWSDVDTSSSLQQRYSINVPREYQQHNIEVAPFDTQQMKTTNYYSPNAYQHVKHENAHYSSGDSLDTSGGLNLSDSIPSPFEHTQQQQHDQSDLNDDDDHDEYEDEELSDKHPSEGGDPRKWVQNQINEANANYNSFKNKPIDAHQYEYPMYNNALADKYEDKDNWWNASSKEKYDMPHQALHGGVDHFDDEADIPLNAFWHKSTVSPDSWHIMKTKFRENMRPGSQEWNKWAYRSDVERKGMKYMPLVGKTWFVKAEEELINCHEFRCKMLEHSALDEYWRMGELRWNRKLWEPYIRIGTWVVAPILGLAATWWYRQAIGYRTSDQFDHEFKRWKDTVARGQGDEHYIFSWRDSLQKRRPPPVVAPAMSVEEHEKRRKRSASYHAERLMTGKAKDPY